MGKTNSRSAEFHLGQEQGHEAEYSAAEKSHSVEYLIWDRGIDVVYSIGFDANEKVAIKAYGGT